ncbi:heparinase II/III domain-containing protein [Microlunatus speluncae]|uniref:heparinase II/III domain-containing protein n=1 Tax=Microlunatus speluncae TaxID=2594267 RepID=UPI0012664619|nr:heparinase II/III family protein [Microlunatus speluncae]
MERRRFLLSALAVPLVAGLAGGTRPAWADEPGTPGAADLPAGGVAIATDQWTIATRAKSAPQIDGRLDDAAWADAAMIGGFVTPYYGDPIDGVAEVRICFDNAALFLAVRYTDPDRAASLTGIEVLINNGTDDFRVPVQVRKPAVAYRNTWGPGLTLVEDAEIATGTVDGGITAELAVPFADLGGAGADGAEWRINVILQHEMMTRPLSSWTPIRTSTNSYNGSGSAAVQAEVTGHDRLGGMYLGALPAAGRPAAPEPYPIKNVALTYTSFTEKVITFGRDGIGPEDVITLAWQAPEGDWTPVSDPRPERGSRQVRIRFGHPGPLRKGLYRLKIIIERANRREPDGLAVITFDRVDLIRAGDSSIELPGPEPSKSIKAAPPSAEVQRLISWISDRNGFIFTGIPDQPQLHPNNLYTFDPDDPDVLQSAYTDERYPNHPDYPEDKLLTVTNRLGQRQEYPYYEDPGTGRRFFLTAQLWFRRREYVLGRLQELAAADPLGAARVLYKFAQVYPGWVPTNEYPWFNRPTDPASTPVNYYWGGTWSRWSASELSAFRNLPYAYAIVARSNAFDLLSDEVGEDVAAKISNEMLLPSIDFYRSYVILYHNMDYHNAMGLIAMGKAFGDPSYIHETVEWAREYGRITYLFDGYYKENTLSYHDQATGGLVQVIDQLAGWTDPEGYASPRSGERFAELDLGAQVPVLANAIEVSQRLVYPDGKLFPMEDTWAYSVSGKPQHDAGSFLMPAGGVARLARGRTVDPAAYFGIVFAFPELEITAESVPHTNFPASGTVQLEATSAGQSITFAFELDRAEEFEVDLRPFRAGSYGRYRVTIDDTALGEVEFYGTGGVNPFETIGTLALTAGPHKITFLGVGKHDASSNFKLGVVQFALLDEAAQADRDNAGEPTGNPAQAYLVYPPKYGHHHYDPLSLAVYAEGQELLPDIGYTHTFYRQWTLSTLAHNTVVVDSSNMAATGKSQHGGNLEIFEHTDEQLQVMRAAEPDAYPQTSEYTREVWQIGFDDSESNGGYLLDLFRVTGGDRHEYALHGDANRDASFSTDLELADYGPYLLPDGVTVTEPTTENDPGDAEGHYYGYIYVRKVKRGEPGDGAYTLRLATTADDGAERAGAKIIGLTGDGGSELFLGESPSVRATRLHGTGKDTNNEAVKYWLPTAVLRKDGTGLRSQFVTMIEPHGAGQPARVNGLERLTPDQAADGSIAVKISYGDVTDLVLSSADPEAPMIVGDVTLTGKLGFVRITGGTVTKLVLIGGTTLSSGDTEVTDDGPVTGTITGVRRRADGDPTDALITSVAVPETMAGKILVVTRPDGKTHGYPIKTVNGTQVEIDGIDPGFRFNDDGSTELQFLPFTRWTGETVFRIENQVSRT